MNPFKSALQSLLHSAGYDVRKTSHIGLDANTDIQRIFGKRPLRVIFDVGAHLGETTQTYFHKFPQAMIYSFEPSPEAFMTLRQAVAEWNRVEPVQKGMDARCGTRKFFLNKFGATNSFLPALAVLPTPQIGSLMENVGVVEVTITTLDDFCAERNIQTIDLLKLDVQGFELEVLHGGRGLLEDERIPLIYTEVSFETHYAGQTTFSQLHPKLTQWGFELVDIYGQTRTSCGVDQVV
jgi:FkbM family methyltransferase